MYYSLISRLHQDLGATVSTIAIGRQANVSLLQDISKWGRGAFFQTDSPSHLPELFLEDIQRHGAQTTMPEKDFAPHTVRPDPVLRELAGRPFPMLKGYVSTGLKPGAWLSMFVERGGRQEPVIASWRYGTGKALAVTTDASGRWSSRWVTADLFTPLWDRLLLWMTPKRAAAQNVDVAFGYHDGRIRIQLTDYAKRPTLGGRLVTAVVTRPDGSKVEAVLSHEVQGELSGAIDAPDPGTYDIQVKSAGSKTRPLPPLAYTVSPAVKAEIPRPRPNYALLEQLASATGGRLNPAPSEVILGRPTVKHRTSLDLYVVAAAMILLIGEALVRRLTA